MSKLQQSENKDASYKGESYVFSPKLVHYNLSKIFFMYLKKYLHVHTYVWICF